MKEIEYYKFLEQLHYAGISSTRQKKYLLIKAFPSLLEESADQILNNFYNNHDNIVKNLNNLVYEDWDTAWKYVNFNTFILSRPNYENFDCPLISSTFNITKEEAIDIMHKFFENFQTNYATIKINEQLTRLECEANEYDTPN